jgi:hypothetical protein
LNLALYVGAYLNELSQLGTNCIPELIQRRDAFGLRAKYQLRIGGHLKSHDLSRSCPHQPFIVDCPVSPFSEGMGLASERAESSL